MTELGILATVLGAFGTVCAIIFGYATYKRNRKEDDSGDGKQKGTLMTEIGYIKSGIDDIKRKQEKQDQQHIEVISRLTAAEASTKQAHKRLDRLERQTPTSEE